MGASCAGRPSLSTPLSVMLAMMMHGCVLVKMSLLMHPIVERTVSRGEHKPHAPVGLRLCASSYGIQIGKRPFNLLQNGHGIGPRKEGTVFHIHHDG